MSLIIHALCENIQE